jgi:glycosyltransferase involved in cell wall biosynthesis
MKILLVSEDLPARMVGGLGKHVVTLGNALISAGHEVSLMGHDALDYKDCAEEIGFNGDFIAGFAKPMQGWKESQLGFYNPWKRPFFARRLATAILEHASHFDVVHYHGHLPMVGLYIPEDVNFVQSRHDQGSECITNVRFKNGDVCSERSPAACASCIHPNPGAIRTRLSALAVARYRKEVVEAFARHPVVFVSDFLRRNFVATMPNASMAKSHVIHNFVDESVLNYTKAISVPAPDPSTVRVHITGRIDEPKGIAALLDLLLPKLPRHWQVNVYGDGPLRQEVQRRHAGNAITFHGHRLYQETVTATCAASVVVVPSVWQEPCGTVILEALRLNKVCYALARGGTPELARYGAAGQLRLYDDLPSLVASLLAADDFADRCGGVSADVKAVFPDLVDVYASGIKTQLGTTV